MIAVLSGCWKRVVLSASRNSSFTGERKLCVVGGVGVSALGPRSSEITFDRGVARGPAVSLPTTMQRAPMTPSNTSTTTGTASGKVVRRRGEKIPHPVFHALAEHTDDEYWRQLLLACGHGKPPKYVVYRDNMLMYRKGRTPIVTALGDAMTSPADLHRVLEFFRSIGLVSSRDNEENQRRVDERQLQLQQQEYTSWQDIRRPQVKEALLRSWMDDCRAELALTPQEYGRLRSALAFAGLFRYITPQTVVMEHGRISHIKGLQVIGETPGQRRFTFPYDMEAAATPGTDSLHDMEPREPQLAVQAAWQKYLGELERRHSHYTQGRKSASTR